VRSRTFDKRFSHEVVRIDVPLKETFDEATQLCESIAPQKDFARVHQLVDVQASWDQVLEQTAVDAPHGLMIYWRLPDTPLMRLAGDDAIHWLPIRGSPRSVAIWTDGSPISWKLLDAPVPEELR
jgi:hypothetical protein